MRKTIYLSFVLAAICLSIGFVAARLTTHSATEEAPDSFSTFSNSPHTDTKTSRPRYTGSKRVSPIKRWISRSSPSSSQTRTRSSTATFQRLDTIIRTTDRENMYVELRDLAYSIPRDELEQWVVEVDSRPYWIRGQHFIIRLLNRWAETDPTAAMDYAMSHPGKDRNKRIAGVIGTWAKQDFSTATAWWRGLPEGRTKAHVLIGLTKVLGSVAKQNPTAAVSFLASLPERSDARSDAFRTVAKAWGMNNFSAAVAWWRGLPEGIEKRQALQGLTEYHGYNNRTEFERSIDFAISLPRSVSRQEAILRMAGGWAQQDFNAALEWAQRLPDAADQQQVITCLAQNINEFAMKDPEAAIEFGLSLPNASLSDLVLHRATHIWAKIDRDAALEWTESLDPGRIRNTAITAVVQQWAQVEPAAAMAYFSETPSNSQRRQVLCSIATQWMRQNATAATHWLLDQPTKMQVDVISSASHSMIKTQPAFVADLCDTLLPPGRERQRIMSQLASSWARSDLSGAVNWIEGLENPQESKSAFRSICGYWVRSDPEGAIAFALNAGTPATQKDMLTTAVRSWGSNNPTKAIAWAEALDDKSMRHQALCDIVNGISYMYPEMAASIITELPEGSQKNSAERTTLTYWIRKDPSAALEWIKSFPDESRKWSAIAQAATSWATDNPSAAAELALSIPDEGQMQQTVSSIIRQWGRYDAVATGDFLQDFSAGKVRDTVVQSYCESIVEHYPGMAAEWSESIEDESRRNSQMEGIARRWIRVDSELAAEWIASSSLPERTRERLLADAGKK